MNNSASTRKFKNKGLSLRFKPYDLQLKHTFTLAGSSRTTTPVMLTEIMYEGITGYGEASMPPYLGESHETATRFLSSVNLEQFNDPFQLETILSYVDNLAPEIARQKRLSTSHCTTW
jgi:L-alanine-DL-glutamate epimerase-like enolase superfamily enzyme